jgi:Rrf2 family transcriptional regulator, iron-sulfur cluster assembly transcription factor
MRLELTRRGDYAVRAMLALAARDPSTPTSGREIATEMGIPVGYMARVMGELVSAGLVESTTGRSGGYVLAGPAGSISLLSVIEAVEGDSRRTSCVVRGSPCGQDGHCQVHGVFFAAQDALLERLRGVSLADVVRARPPAKRRKT